MDTRTAIAALGALAQESRLAIFRLLVEAGPTGLAVGEIGASLHISPATLSFHLKELSHVALIASRQDGRYIYYTANYPQMNKLIGYLTDNCCAADGTDCCAPAAPSRGKQAVTRRTGRGVSRTR